MGALSVPTAAGYICDVAFYRTRTEALSCAISAPSASYGGTFLREMSERIVGAIAYRWPSSVYVTRRSEKYADVLAALYGMLLDGMPWANERMLVTRLPREDYPRNCSPRMPLPSCPDPLSYIRAAQTAPYIDGLICIVTGVLVGRLIGAFLWHHSVNRTPEAPAQNSPQNRRTANEATPLLGQQPRIEADV